MKTIAKALAAILAVGLITFGCKPDQSVNPKSSAKPEFGLAGDTLHDQPTPECNQAALADFIDSNGSKTGGDPFEFTVGPYGTVEVLNDVDSWWILVSMGFYWLAAEGKIYVGPCAAVPLNPDQSVNWEGFAWGSSTPASQYVQWTIPVNQLNLDANGCACMVVVVEGVQSDFYGGAYNNTILWADGGVNVGTNGKGLNVCFAPCPFGQDEECHDIDRANGRNCEDITIIASNATFVGASPFTFKLYQGTTAQVLAGTATFMSSQTSTTGSATFNVCPTGTSGVTKYTVLTSDSRSTYTDSLEVNVSNTPTCAPPCTVPSPGSVSAIPAEYSCGQTNQGERKVNVCHLPPGNPANRQMICIAVSALPAHVIDFKPANNRCMGHESGCHIGPCDPCGPGTSDDAIARAQAYRLQYGCSGL